MIARARELLAEVVDVAQAARALPHIIEKSKELELRILALEDQSKQLRADVGAIADAAAHIHAVVSELYVGPAPTDAEVPDA